MLGETVNDTFIWQIGVVVISTHHFRSTEALLRFSTDSNLSCDISETYHGKKFWQLCQIEIRLDLLSFMNYFEKSIHNHYQAMFKELAF